MIKGHKQPRRETGPRGKNSQQRKQGQRARTAKQGPRGEHSREGRSAKWWNIHRRSNGPRHWPRFEGALGTLPELPQPGNVLRSLESQGEAPLVQSGAHLEPLLHPPLKLLRKGQQGSHRDRLSRHKLARGKCRKDLHGRASADTRSTRGPGGSRGQDPGEAEEGREEGTREGLTCSGSLLCGPTRWPGSSANVAPKARDVVAARGPTVHTRHTEGTATYSSENKRRCTHRRCTQKSAKKPGCGSSSALAIPAIKEEHTGSFTQPSPVPMEHAREVLPRVAEKAFCLSTRGQHAA